MANNYKNSPSFYNSVKWQKLRNKIIDKQPYCTICMKTWSLQVDHIIEFKNNPELFFDENNLQTLCINCHSIKSGIELLFPAFVINNNIVFTLDWNPVDPLINKINEYKPFFRNNLLETLDRVLLEIPLTVNNRINLYDMPLGLIYFVLFKLFHQYKLLPKELICGANFPKSRYNIINKWFTTKKHRRG